MSVVSFAQKAVKILPVPPESPKAAPRRNKGKKQTNILFIGDPHFKDDNLLETQLLQETTLRLIKAHRVDCVIVLGDTLHEHRVMYSTSHARAITYLSEIHKLTRLALVIGNHDMLHQKVFMDGIHGFTGLKEWDRVNLIDRTTSFDVGNIKIVGVPYVPKGMFGKALETQEFDYKKADLIVAHQEFYGILGKISDDGDVWKAEDPLVVTGHIHDYSWHRKNILYTGSPMMTKYGEKQDKTVSLFTYDSESKIPKETRYNLGIPPLITIHMSAKEALEWKIPEKILSTHTAHRRVRLYIRGSAVEITTLKKSGRIGYLESEGIKITEKTDIVTSTPIGYLEKSLGGMKEEIRAILNKPQSEWTDADSEKIITTDKGVFYQRCLSKVVNEEAISGVKEIYKELITNNEE